MTHLPGLDAIDPSVRVRSIAWHGMDQAEPMTDACGASVPRISSHAPIVLGSLPLVEQRGVIAFLNSKDRVTSVIV